MEAPQLTIDPEFWTQDTNVALLNLRTPAFADLRAALERAAGAAGLRSHVIFATSGSSGDPKFACLSRQALLTSAAAVNAHLSITASDRWFCALPLFHVGGVGIWARSYLLGCPVSFLVGRWNSRRFCEQLAESEATLTSLVPTQIFDIVAGRCECPRHLRAVLVGGGALNKSLREKASELGWPLLETFGMTEAASQIATHALEVAKRSEAGSELVALPLWELRVSNSGSAAAREGELEIRGAALFSGYLEREAENAGRGFAFRCPLDSDGWFSTSDCVRLIKDGFSATCLVPIRRADETVKILGENVDVGAVQAAVDPVAMSIIVVALPDAREGSRLVAAAESGATDDHRSNLEQRAAVENALRRHNRDAQRQERILSVAFVPEFPRTTLGKVSKPQLVSTLFNLKTLPLIDR